MFRYLFGLSDRATVRIEREPAQDGRVLSHGHGGPRRRYSNRSQRRRAPRLDLGKQSSAEVALNVEWATKAAAEEAWRSASVPDQPALSDASGRA